MYILKDYYFRELGGTVYGMFSVFTNFQCELYALVSHGSDRTADIDFFTKRMTVSSGSKVRLYIATA